MVHLMSGIKNFTNQFLAIDLLHDAILGGQLQLLPLQHLGDVQVEEIAVEDCLDTAGHDGNHVVEGLGVVAVDPVENVEAAVGAEGKEVVAGDALGLPGLGHHEQLGQDGDGLQVDRERPEDFHHGELMVENQAEKQRGTDKKLDPEGVVVAVVGGLELHVHQIDGSGSRADEEELHGGVVEGDEGGEEVEVARTEDGQEEDLRLARNAGAAAGLPDLVESIVIVMRFALSSVHL